MKMSLGHGRALAKRGLARVLMPVQEGDSGLYGPQEFEGSSEGVRRLNAGSRWNREVPVYVVEYCISAFQQRQRE